MLIDVYRTCSTPIVDYITCCCMIVVTELGTSSSLCHRCDAGKIGSPLLQVVFACRGKNLFFSAEPKKHIAECDMIFVSVNTPTKTKGVGAHKAADLSFWEGAARMIASVSKSSKIVVEKSTVPVKTAEAIGKVRVLHAR